MNKLALLALAASFASAALAQDRSFLPKADVEALANGKKWNHRRAADGHNVRWDLREGGNLFANNYTANGSDSGTWSVNDQGQLCVKWRGRSANRCVGVVKNGDKLTMVDAQEPAGTYGELTVE
jgi:hypothetical protein